MHLFAAEVSRVTDLTHDVREIELRLIHPPEIEFQAGQFVSFEIQQAGMPRPLTRAYSIASPPSQRDRITLVFNLIERGPGSNYLFGLRLGDKAQFKGPAGSFRLRNDGARDLLFVATGTGIAPIRSMVLDWLEGGAARAALLYWGLRSQRDLYYQDEFSRLAKVHAQFTFVTTLSRPEPGWTGAGGRVTTLVSERVMSVSNLAVYLCGNGAMIKELTVTLNAKGLCPIYREKWYDDPAGANGD